MPNQTFLRVRKKITTGIFQTWQKTLWKFGWDWRRALSPGFTILGIDFFRAKRVVGKQSENALNQVLSYPFETVLDVGAGSLVHSKKFSEREKKVTAIDLGDSIYFKDMNSDDGKNIEIILENFTKFKTNRQWDLIWASHILEHQKNVGDFLEKLISLCSEGGLICITVPIPHRTLWSGHLTLWTPGLVIYNLVLCSIDTSKSEVIVGNGEFTVVLSPRKIILPKDLVFDQGDLTKLHPFLPSWVYENSDPWDFPQKINN